MGNAGQKVFVACKITNGLILHVDTPHTYMQPTLSGPRETTEYRKGDPVRVYGPGYPINPETQWAEANPKPMMLSGYAVTSGISADWWDAWYEQHKNEPMVKNGLIGAKPTIDALRGWCKERVAFRSGLEPLQIEGDPRTPRPVPGVAKVQTESIGSPE